MWGGVANSLLMSHIIREMSHNSPDIFFFFLRHYSNNTMCHIFSQNSKTVPLRLCTTRPHRDPCLQPVVAASRAYSCTLRPGSSPSPVWWCHSWAPWPGSLGCSHCPGSHSSVSGDPGWRWGWVERVKRKRCWREEKNCSLFTKLPRWRGPCQKCNFTWMWLCCWSRHIEQVMRHSLSDSQTRISGVSSWRWS